MDKMKEFIKLFEEAGGVGAERGTLKRISEKLGVPEGTIRRWKSEYVKKNKMNVQRTFAKKERSEDVVKDRANKKKVIVANLEEEIKKDKDLTEKEMLFCLYYIKDFNAGMAVKKAGYNTENNHYVIGSTLLKKPHIRRYIDELREQMSGELMLDINRVLEMFNRIAFYDINDYFELKTIKQVVRGAFGRIVEDGNGKPMVEEIQVLALKEGWDGQVISGISQKDGEVKIEMPDRLKALEFLAKFMDYPDKLAKERFEHDKEKYNDEKAIEVENENNSKNIITEIIGKADLNAKNNKS